MTTPAQGMRRVRTLSAIKRSGVQNNERHVHQFRLAALELESSRLLREKQAAERRIGEIVSRLQEIQLKMRQHRGLLDCGEAVPSSSLPRPTPRLLRY